MSRELDARQVVEMRRAWAGGANAPALALRFGISPSCVWKVCEPRAFEGRGPEPRATRARQSGPRVAPERVARARTAAEKARRDDEIRRLWADGWRGVELSGRFGLSRSAVSGIVAGLPGHRRYGDPWDVAYPHPRRRAPAGPGRAPRPRTLGPLDPGDILPARRPGPKGSAHGRSKLGEADVALLRGLRASGESYPALARRFGISRSNVWYILSGSTWGHVPGAIPAGGGGRC